MYTGNPLPPGERVYGQDSTPDLTAELVSNATAKSLNDRMGFGGWTVLGLDYAAVVLNFLLWATLFWHFALRNSSDSADEIKGSLADGDVEKNKKNENQVTDEAMKISSAPEQASRPAALRVVNMSKSYDGTKFVNTDISFEVRPGQIFALLGHNGAGKTTLLRQLTALIPSTSGDAVVNGFSVKANPSEVRKRLGFCPQQNPMWKGYTMREHLLFFLDLQNSTGKKVTLQNPTHPGMTGGSERCGASSKPAERHQVKNAEQSDFLTAKMLDYAEALGIKEKLDTNCAALSGGQKRRMWTLCALLQQDSLLLLDEPTSGLDPQARRDFWILLDRVCREENRACVFSTHYLEEADMLAEEKVILAHGEVVASGTSGQMKVEHGAGFWITLQSENEGSAPSDKSDSKLSRSDLLLRASREVIFHNPRTKIRLQQITKTDAPGRFLQCLVPYEHAAALPVILEDLSKPEVQQQFSLDERVTVQKTTLEEVFQKLGEDEEDEDVAQEALFRASLVAGADIVDAAKGGDAQATYISTDPSTNNSSRTVEAKKKNNNDTDISAAKAGTTSATMKNTLTTRTFHFWRQVLAVCRFRFQSEFTAVFIPAVAVILFLWLFCARTPDNGNTVFASAPELTSVYFSLLAFVGCGQALLTGRFREEREQGRLAHLLIHGVSRSAYKLGTVLFFLLPALLVMLLGFAAATQTLSTPWKYGTPTLQAMLWLLGLIYSIDALVLGSLLAEGQPWRSNLFLILQLVLPVILYGPFLQTPPRVVLAADEEISSVSKLMTQTYFPNDVSDPLPLMSASKALTAIQRIALPIFFPNIAMAVVYKDLLNKRNVLAWLHFYWEGLKDAMAARSFVVGDTDAIADTLLQNATLQDRVMAGTAAMVQRDKFHFEKVQALTAKYQTPQFYFGASFPGYLMKVLNSATPADLSFGIVKKDNPRVVIRTESLQNSVRHESWASGQDFVTTVNVWTWLSLFFGFFLRLAMWLLSIFCDGHQGRRRGLFSCCTKRANAKGNKQAHHHSPQGALRAVGPSDEQDEARDPLLSASKGQKIAHAYTDPFPEDDGRDPDVVEEERRLRHVLNKERTHGSAPEVVGAATTGMLKIYRNKASTTSIIHPDDIAVLDLEKKFDNPANPSCPKYALGGVSLGVQSGQCFGLLGPNGAGKSTLFTMLSGNYDDSGPPTDGQIIVFGEDVTRSGFGKAYQKMGIVPQFDYHLFPYATARQHLELYVKISGVEIAKHSWSMNALQLMEKQVIANKKGRVPSPTDTTTLLIDAILNSVGLDPYSPKVVGEYSGGMMRRLSFAVALITEPKILLLDELSAGVDIVSQRLLWKVLQNRASNQTVITTTHSMSEVEAVCDRVCILVSGKLQCLGTTSRIKQVYGSLCHVDLYCRALNNNKKNLELDGAAPVGMDAAIVEILADVQQLLLHGRHNSEVEKTICDDAASIVSPSASEEHNNADEATGVIELPLSSTSKMEETAAAGAAAASAKLFVLEKHAFSDSRFRVMLGVERQSLRMEKLFQWCQENSSSAAGSGAGCSMQLCRNKSFAVEDFSIGEPTIEQIFLKFAAKQEAILLEEEQTKMDI
ncbi:unnamed protein product [Amoebophrya sp. A120]|nr:unnamed protein product [Amoebophrya sp. A120]|eukprot:GSA120T00011105001.1